MKTDVLDPFEEIKHYHQLIELLHIKQVNELRKQIYELKEEIRKLKGK